MIIDASAILALILREPDAEVYRDAIASARGEALISPVNYVEVGLRVDRLGAAFSRAYERLLLSEQISIAPVTAEQARIARDAYRRFGKGNHPARLNLGDCFAYALATARGEPLLFKGGDFALTDVRPAL